MPSAPTTRRPLPLRPALAALLALGSSAAVCAPTAAFAVVPAGESITGAAAIDITPSGFEAVTGLIPTLLPPNLEVGALGDGYAGALGQCWLGGYEYGLNGLWVGISVTNADIIPRDGYLDILIEAQVQVNDPSDRFELYTELECIGDTCYGHVAPFDVSLSTRVDLSIIENPDGTRGLDANVGGITVDYSLTGSMIQLDECAIGTVEDVLNLVGLSIFDLILTFAGGFIDDAVAGFVPEIEALLEDNFSAVNIEQDVDLNGISAHVSLAPGEVQIKPEGLRIRMDGSLDVAEVASCIAAYDPGGSNAVDSPLPDIGSAGPDASPNPQLGVHLSDEFGNQALYSLWRGGLLCYTVDEELTGFALDTNILGLLAGDTFDSLFPESRPIFIQTAPRTPPELVYNGDHDVALDIADLGLEFYAELDHRKSMIVAVDVNTEAGIDLALDSASGALGIEVALAGEDIVPVVTDNEFAPGAEADIEANFAGVFDTLVTPLLGSLLGDLAFNLPAISGFGLTSLEVSENGEAEDWLGVYAGIGAVSYGGAGCDSADGGCGGGCGVTGKPGGRLALLGVLPLAFVLARRRR